MMKYLLQFVCVVIAILISSNCFAQNAIPGPVAGGFEVRITQMENDLRELRGMLENIQFNLHKIEETQARQASDVDFRLTELEKWKASGTQSPQVQQSEPSIGTPPAFLGPPVIKPAEGAPFQNPFIHSLPALETPSVRQPETKEMDPQKEYDQAYGFLKKADYEAAEGALQAFIEKYPEHKLAGNAQYWLGETYYVRGKYEDAAIEFGQGFDKYPEGAKASDSLYKLGMSMEKLERKEEACRAFGLFSTAALKKASAELKQKAKSERAKLKCK